ncbi:MAG TPA: helix-turn-helix domain-containing protein [Nitrososphaeraceae archaeon]|nr:helix-turn-helix domain-containing protein [Nitrososphaeraceae archaeon]
MKAVYIVDDAKIAKVLIDPMRRAILGLLRQMPMTQAGLANELGLTAASLNYHMNILRSKRLVTIAKKEVERHRIMQIFFSTTAYLFVYDLDSLPKNIARYFYPVSLERARAVVVSLLVLNRTVLSSSSSQSSMYAIDKTPESIDAISEDLSRFLVKTAKSYEDKVVNHGDESIIYEIYSKALSRLLKEKNIRNSLLVRKPTS